MQIVVLSTFIGLATAWYISTFILTFIIRILWIWGSVTWLNDFFIMAYSNSDRCSHIFWIKCQRTILVITSNIFTIFSNLINYKAWHIWVSNLAISLTINCLISNRLTLAICYWLTLIICVMECLMSIVCSIIDLNIWIRPMINIITSCKCLAIYFSNAWCVTINCRCIKFIK